MFFHMLNSETKTTEDPKPRVFKLNISSNSYLKTTDPNLLIDTNLIEKEVEFKERTVINKKNSPVNRTRMKFLSEIKDEKIDLLKVKK